MSLRTIDQLFSSTGKKYKKGQIIMHSGDELTHAYMLTSGFVKMYSISTEGEEKILLIFPKNSPFPIFPGMVDDPHYKLRYFYEAMTDISIVSMPLEEFSDLMKKDKELSTLILSYVTNLSGVLVRRLGIIENKDAKSKIAELLRYLMEVCGEEIGPQKYKLLLKITHQDIAALAGITRETASVQIKTLEDEGVIDQNDKGRLVIYEKLLPTQ